MQIIKFSTSLVTAALFCTILSSQIPLAASRDLRSITQAQINKQSSSDLLPVLVNGKYGYINRTGKTVVKPQFNFGSDFSQGLAVVAINGKWGCIDNTGKTVQTNF